MRHALLAIVAGPMLEWFTEQAIRWTWETSCTPLPSLACEI